MTEKETAQGGQQSCDGCSRLERLENVVADLKLEIEKLRNIENIFMSRETAEKIRTSLVEKLDNYGKNLLEELEQERIKTGLCPEKLPENTSKQEQRP